METKSLKRNNSIGKGHLNVWNNHKDYNEYVIQDTLYSDIINASTGNPFVTLRYAATNKWMVISLAQRSLKYNKWQ